MNKHSFAVCPNNEWVFNDNSMKQNIYTQVAKQINKFEALFV